MEFGVSGTPLAWIRSYLNDRLQFVKLGQYQSSVTKLEVKSAFHRVLYSDLCCSRSTPAQSPTSLHNTVYNFINTQMTRSSISRYELTTLLLDWPFSLYVLPTFDCGTCRMVCNSIQTNRKYLSSGRRTSCV